MDIKDKELKRKIIEIASDFSKEIAADRKEHDGVYMFFSFDLENSTRFKSSYPDKWRCLIETFYEITKRTFKGNLEKKYDKDEQHDIDTNYNKFGVWKLIGDEILFYKKVDNLEELFFNVKATYYTLEEVYELLCSNEELNQNNKDIIKANIDIKAAVWIAKCEQACDGRDSNTIYMNSLSNNPELDIAANSLGEHFRQIDFLGPDIDEGFRISKCCSKRKVTVSAKLAYAIYCISKEKYNLDNKGEKYIFSDIDRRSINSFFKIVQYKKLKGIWAGRLYPIILYTHKWDKQDEVFEYDEYFSNEIVKSIYTMQLEKASKIEFLNKIFDDLNRKDEVEDIIQNIIQKMSEKKDNTENSMVTKRKGYVNSEVHCVAMCFNDDKVLILKRSSQRRMPNLWECGCGKINNNESWENCLENEYKELIGVDIEIDENPIPVASFKLEKDNVIVPGIIFLAKLKSTNLKIKESKFSESSWKTIDEIRQMKEDEFVPDLKANIERGFGIFDNINKK